MFRAVRFPIAGLMSAVVVVPLGLAALRNASETWAGATFLSTCAVLCLAIVGVVCRGESERAWWLGFALFGWGYLILAFWSSLELPTMALLDALGSRSAWRPNSAAGCGAPPWGAEFRASLSSLREDLVSAPLRTCRFNRSLIASGRCSPPCSGVSSPPPSSAVRRTRRETRYPDATRR